MKLSRKTVLFAGVLLTMVLAVVALAVGAGTAKAIKDSPTVQGNDDIVYFEITQSDVSYLASATQTDASNYSNLVGKYYFPSIDDAAAYITSVKSDLKLSDAVLPISIRFIEDKDIGNVYPQAWVTEMTDAKVAEAKQKYRDLATSFTFHSFSEADEEIMSAVMDALLGDGLPSAVNADVVTAAINSAKIGDNSLTEAQKNRANEILSADFISKYLNAQWIGEYAVYFKSEAPVNGTKVPLVGSYSVGGYEFGWQDGGFNYNSSQPETLLLQNLGGFVISYDMILGMKEFNCGIDAYDAALDGKTMVVELRMYEAKNLGSAILWGNDLEDYTTGTYAVMSTTEYTFGAVVLTKGDTVVGKYGTIEEAVNAFNAATEAGNYTIEIADGTYAVADAMIKEDPTKKLVVKAKNANKVTINWDTAGDCLDLKQIGAEQYEAVTDTVDPTYKAIFAINGGSSYSTDMVTFDGLNFNVPAKGEAFWFMGNSTSDPFACKYLGNNGARYVSNVTIKNCNFEAVTQGEGRTAYSISGSQPAGIKFYNCTATGLSYLYGGYGTNNATITTVEGTFGWVFENVTSNCAGGINVQNGGDILVKNCTINTTKQYAVRSNGGNIYVLDSTLTCTEDSAGGVVMFNGGTNPTATILNSTLTRAEGGKDYDVYGKGAYVVKTGSYANGAAALTADVAQAAKVGYNFSTPVAQIGDVPYPSLEAAIAAAPLDGTETTIVMLKDVNAEKGLVIPYGANIVLELNGKVLGGVTTKSGNTQLIYNKGTLTIQDNTDTKKDGTGTGCITNACTSPDENPIPSYASNTIFNRGTLTVKSGKIASTTSSGAATYAIDNQTAWYDSMATVTLNIEGGLVTRPSGTVIRMCIACGGYQLNNQDVINNVNISGGVISGDQPLWVQLSGTSNAYGNLSISGGTFNALGETALDDSTYDAATFNNVTYSITGGVFKGAVNFEEMTGFISGGTFMKAPIGGWGWLFVDENSKVYEYQYSSGAYVAGTPYEGVWADKAYWESNGYTFTYYPNYNLYYVKATMPFDTDWVAAGYTTQDSAVITDGNYLDVVQANYVAKIGNTQYTSLADAIAAVKNGETITMLSDVTAVGGISVPSGKNFTVDFDGHTYSVEKPGAGSAGTKTQAFQLLKDSTITFKNGTINCTAANKDFTWASDAAEKGVAMVIQNYCNLTLDNMTIDGSNIAHNGGSVRYVISNNCGTVTLKDTTVTAVGNDFAFDSCKYGDYTAPVVSVTGTSVINGKVEASGGSISFKTGSTLNGMLRVGENKADGCTGSIVTVENGATVNCQSSFIGVFGQNTLNIAGAVNGYIATNGNAYNGGSVINIQEGANITASGDVAVYMPNGELNISGGTVTGQTAVYFKSTKLNITGGTLVGNGAAAAYQYDGSGCTATGDALVIDSCNYPNGIEKVSISGGTFKSTNGKGVAAFTSQNGTAVTKFITGGTYSARPDSAYLADGYISSEVKDTSVTMYVVSMNTVQPQQNEELAKPTDSTPLADESFNGITVKKVVEEQQQEQVRDFDTENTDQTTKAAEQAAKAEAQKKIAETVNNNEAVNTYLSTKIEEATTKNTDETKAAASLTLVQQALKTAVAEAVNDTSSQINTADQKTEAENQVKTVEAAKLTSFVSVDPTAATVKQTVTTDQSATTMNTIVKTMTFEVKPTVTTTVEITVGDATTTETITAVIPNEAIDSPIDFRLPIDKDVPVGTIVKVYHQKTASDEREDFGSYAVQQDENGNKYIQLANDNFSFYSYELTEELIGSADYSATLSLADSIDIIFYMKNLKAGTAVGDYSVKATYKGATTVCTLEEAKDAQGTVIAGKYRTVIASCAAMEMFEKVHVQIFYKGVQINEFDYSVYDYCNSKINKAETGDELKELCKAALDYGTYARTFFKYQEKNPVESSYTARDVSDVGVTGTGAGMSGTVTGIKSVSATLSLESRTAIYMYFTPEAGYTKDNYTFTVGDRTLTPTTDAKGRIQVIVDGIAASKLGDTYSVVCTNTGDSTATTVTYSPMGYAAAKQSSKTANLPNVCKALSKYYDAAKAFFN